MNARGMAVRIGLRGKEQPARITGVSTITSHGCQVGINCHVTNGSLPDVWVAFSTDDPHTAILARKLVEALDANGVKWRSEAEAEEETETCGRCGEEYPAGGSCSGPGYHP